MNYEVYGWETCNGAVVDEPLEDNLDVARNYARDNCLRLIAYKYELVDTELVESYCKPPDVNNDEIGE